MDFSDCMVNSWPQFVHLYVPADTSLPVGTGSAIETSCVRSDLPYPAGARQNSRVADVDALEGGEPACARSRRSPAASPAQYPARTGRGERWRLGAAPAQTALPTAAPASLLATGESPRQPCRRPDSRRRPARGHHGIAEEPRSQFRSFTRCPRSRNSPGPRRGDGPGAGRAPARRLRDPRPRLALGLCKTAPAHLLSACQGG